MREALPNYERDAALAAEQARLRPDDEGAQVFAAEQQAQLDTLRARIARVEAGEVDGLPDALVIDALHAAEQRRAQAQDPPAVREAREALDDAAARVEAGETVTADFGPVRVEAGPEGFRVTGLDGLDPAAAAVTASRLGQVLDRDGVDGVLRDVLGDPPPPRAPGADPAPRAARQAEPQGAPDEYAIAANDAVTEMPGLMVADEDGTIRPASALLADADEALRQARVEADAIDAAVSCFLRSGT